MSKGNGSAGRASASAATGNANEVDTRKADVARQRAAINAFFNATQKVGKIYDEELRENEWGKWYAQVKTYQEGVANSLESALGISFRKDLEGTTFAFVGPARIKLDYDSGYTTVSENWVQHVRRERKGGLVLTIERLGYRVNYALTGASRSYLRAVTNLLKDIKGIKESDIANAPGHGSDLKKDYLVRKAIEKHKGEIWAAEHLS